ncbi:MAG: ABC transporter permease [Acidobacteria bacterium]|nr:ABC transporter permease [Acidobacteriota bacterium]
MLSRPVGRRPAALMLTLLLVTVAPSLAPQEPNSTPDPAAAQDRPPGTTLYAVALSDGRTLLVDAIDSGPAGGLTVVRQGTRQELDLASLASTQAKPRRFILGTDHLGRDLLSRVLHGLRTSLGIALVATILALTVGTLVGLVAAGAGGWLDELTMRIVDVLMAVPKLFLVLAIAATLGPSRGLLVTLLAATTWMPIARIVRARTVTLRAAPFSTAARAIGCSPRRVLTHHYLPHLAGTLWTLGVLGVGNLILLESALSFLGAGLPPPVATLGGMVAEAALQSTPSWWSIVFPGAAIVLPSLACAWVADQITAVR